MPEDWGDFIDASLQIKRDNDEARNGTMLLLGIKDIPWIQTSRYYFTELLLKKGKP